MVKHADLLICDSKGIQSYIEEKYSKFKPNTHLLLMEPIQTGC